MIFNLNCGITEGKSISKQLIIQVSISKNRILIMNDINEYQKS